MDFTNVLVSRSSAGEKIVHIEVSAESVSKLLADIRSVVRRYDAEAKSGVAELERDCVVNASLGEALRRTGLEPLVTPDVHAEAYPEEGQPFAYEACIVERPQLSLDSVDPVSVSLDPVRADDEYVARRLAAYMDGFSRYEDAEPHPVETGNFLYVDLTTLKNGAPCLRLSGIGKVLQITYDDMPAPFIDQMLGMNVGEKRTIEYEVQRDRAISDNDVDKYVAVVEVRKQLREVRQEITDEWVAANFPPLTSADEFRNRFREKVTHEAEEANLDALGRQANIALESRLVGAIPDKLYELSAKREMDDLEEKLKKEGKTLDEYLADNETNLEELSVKFLARAGEGLRQAFALETLFDMRHMSLTEDDLNIAAKGIFKQNCEKAWSGRERDRSFPLVESAAKRMKALEWLVDTAEVSSVREGDEVAATVGR